MDPRDYILDIQGVAAPRPQPPAPTDATTQGKPWIAIHWKCCHTYSRLYRNAAGTAYVGQCPKCGSPAQATIGEGGTNQRFFKAE